MSVMSVVRPSASVARADARAEARCGVGARDDDRGGEGASTARDVRARGGTGASVAREEGAVVDASSSRARVAVVVRAKSSRDGEEVWGGVAGRRRGVGMFARVTRRVAVEMRVRLDRWMWRVAELG